MKLTEPRLDTWAISRAITDSGMESTEILFAINKAGYSTTLQSIRNWRAGSPLTAPYLLVLAKVLGRDPGDFLLPAEE